MSLVVKILGSNSKGNCYILEGEKETLLLECGLPFKEILRGLEFKLDKVVGCLVTHEHKDHCKGIEKALGSAIDCYTSQGTIDALGASNTFLHSVEKNKIFKIGGFSIMPFDVHHDANEPYGYLIKHQEMGLMLFATDTYYLDYKFSNLNHILIECNYDKNILEESGLDDSVKARIIKSHFEINNVKDFLKANDLSDVRNIILLHLSESNSSDNFLKEIDQVSLNQNSVFIAEKGLEVNLDLTPF